MTGQTSKRARPWESRQQQRSADIHRQNRERIARERATMAERWRKAATRSLFKIICATAEGCVPDVKSKARDCLRCERAFQSSGPGNRLCDVCRRRTAGIDETSVGIGLG